MERRLRRYVQLMDINLTSTPHRPRSSPDATTISVISTYVRTVTPLRDDFTLICLAADAVETALLGIGGQRGKKGVAGTREFARISRTI